MAKELRERGVTTKARLTKTGKARDGRPIDKNYLYRLLSNRMFLGELYYSDAWQQSGTHPYSACHATPLAVSSLRSRGVCENRGDSYIEDLTECETKAEL